MHHLHAEQAATRRAPARAATPGTTPGPARRAHRARPSSRRQARCHVGLAPFPAHAVAPADRGMRAAAEAHTLEGTDVPVLAGADQTRARLTGRPRPTHSPLEGR